MGSKKKATKATTETTEATTDVALAATHEGATASGTQANAGPTLHDMAEGYLGWIDKEGAGDGTISSYGAELKLAMRELGDKTLLAELTAERVGEYFESAPVTLTRSGKRKAKPTIDKSRRVLRLALMWAKDEGLINVAPIPASATKPAKLQAI